MKVRKIKQARRHQEAILWLVIISIFLLGVAAGAVACVAIAVCGGLI